MLLRARPGQALEAAVGSSRACPASASASSTAAKETTRWPFIYGYSPSVVPRPPDWRKGIEVAGYWWPENTRPAGHPEDLELFRRRAAAGVRRLRQQEPRGRGRLTEIVAAARRQAGVRIGRSRSGWAGPARGSRTMRT